MAEPTPNPMGLPPAAPPPSEPAPAEPNKQPIKAGSSNRERAAKLRKVLRGLSLVGFTLLALLAGLAYPAIARGNELFYANFQQRWWLLLLLLVPALFYRGTLGEDRRLPRARLGTLMALRVGPSGPRVWLRDLPGVLR